MDTRLRPWLLAAVVLVTGMLSARARATTFIMADTAKLFRISDAVVVARVDAIRSVDDERGLRTHIGLQVEEMLKGPASVRLEIVEPGGVLGEKRRWVQGTPSFFVGERVVVFVRANAQQELETTFLAMGKFTVARSSSGAEFAIRNLSDGRVLQARRNTLERSPSVTTYDLPELLGRLRTWAAAAPNNLRVLATPPRPASPAGSRWQANFTFTGPPFVRWFLPDDGQPIPYYVNQDGDMELGPSDSFAAVDAALGAWNSTGCASVNLVDAGPADPTPFNVCDGKTEINFNDPFSEMPAADECSGVVGIGGVCADSTAAVSLNGVPYFRITEGDVVVSKGFWGCPFWNATNIAELLTHEVGHTLGLAHSSNDPSESDPSLREATMYYAAHFDGRGATVMSDDIAAVCTMYPNGRRGTVTLRRFAIVSGTLATPSDRLVVDGVLTLDDTSFDPNADTLIIDVRAAGVSAFRIAVLAGTWLKDSLNTRFVYRGFTGTGVTTVALAHDPDGTWRLRLRAHGLDLSAARIDPLMMVLELGGANLTETMPGLRSNARSRVFP